MGGKHGAQRPSQASGQADELRPISEHKPLQSELFAGVHLSKYRHTTYEYVKSALPNPIVPVAQKRNLDLVHRSTFAGPPK
jgi:hypothetical protein